jgi:hypothetical protein
MGMSGTIASSGSRRNSEVERGNGGENSLMI